MKYNPNSFLFVLFASVLFLVFNGRPAEALSLELPELKAKFEALHSELVDFSQHSSLVELVRRRGGSSGGSSGGRSGGSSSSGSSSSSSGSRGSSSSSSSNSGSSSSGSRGSSSSSSSSSGSGSTSSSRSGRSGGGSALPIAAGAVTGLGLASLLILASSANSHYPGNWGNNGVYSYHYNTTLNDTNYDVTCYCMRYNPCTCEKVEDKSYFDELPQNISRTSVKDNVTYVYINGTGENTTTSGTSSDTTTSGAVSSVYNNMGSGTLLVLSIATLSFLL
ncbi:hypothetical protein DV113_003978 [Geotrichum candidum]|uniref:DUF7732 domain-containing protein n=1 Tax=Geotrichum candidum TaxID=1173061 RepID=A0A0J9X938_GEOCN|nr:hypothetical protein DV452_000406 [Geotrichum candidum]KAF7497982.1 hypothetical protein DV113_003978 [Geotrichum candidum]KAI8134847.1 hypothetical protein DUD61_001536 [Geotrichum candidum]KAI9212729.1 hypothetical protein DS838_002400 [Geotrichum bryndzae]CDO53757.1 Conserved hypothetical protein [Geotrichum candidum]